MKKEIEQALKVLRSGGVILYPTDTIWGIGCDATNNQAIERIYSIKKRVQTKKLSRADGTILIKKLKKE